MGKVITGAVEISNQGDSVTVFVNDDRDKVVAVIMVRTNNLKEIEITYQGKGIKIPKEFGDANVASKSIQNKR